MGIQKLLPDHEDDEAAQNDSNLVTDGQSIKVPVLDVHKPSFDSMMKRASPLKSLKGYLKKRHGNLSMIHTKKWCVLSKNKLIYYNNKTSDIPNGILNFNQLCARVLPVGEKEFQIVIDGTAKTFNFLAPGPTARDKWVHMIELHIK